MSEKASRKTFHARLQAMVGQLRMGILDGTYPVDDYLPAESALAEQFQLSNNSVRKGLEILVAEGLIVKIDKVGSRVVQTSGRERVTVTVGCTPSISRDLGVAKLVEDFQELHPDIVIKPVTGTASGLFTNRTYADSIREQMGSGAIDLFTVNNMNFNELVEQGYTELLEAQQPSAAAYPFLNAAFSSNGALYAQPLIFSPVVLCYNRSHFREAQLPEPDSSWRWPDLVEAASRLTVPGQKHGFYFYQVSENRWPLFLLQSGQSFGREGDRLADIRGSALMDGIRLCGELTRNPDIFPNYFSESSSDASRLFLDGQISMLLATYSSLNDFQQSDLDYDLSPVPFMSIPITLLFSIGMVMNKHSRNKEAAQLFLNYLASSRAQQIIRLQTVSIPASKPIAEQPCPQAGGINRPRHYSLFREIIPSYRLHGELNLPARAFEPLRHLLKMFWSGLIDEAALAERLTKLPLDD